MQPQYRKAMKMEPQTRERIGSGARADVYREGPYALKIFHPGTNPALITREAYICKLVAEAGLPVPKAHGMAELPEGLAIKMENVAGKTLHDAMAENPSQWESYMQNLAALQHQIHQAPVELPFTLSEWLESRLTAAPLEESLKAPLLRQLKTMPTGKALCHGDFHGGNVLTDGTNYTIIDWANATSGPPEADACRTYIIYALHIPDLAEGYLTAYCACARQPKEAVRSWLPVLAGARLSEGFPEERQPLLSWITAFQNEK